MRKNVIKFTAIALLSVFALAACDDDIIAKPEGYDDSPVVSVDKDVYNNNLKDIYDAIRDGELPSKVMDELLYQFSVSVFGNYNKVTAAKITYAEESYGETTLKAAVKDLTIDADDNCTGGGETAKAFIKAHSAYWTKNDKGQRVGGDDAEVTKMEFARLYNKWKTIEKRISEKFYDMISGGSYSEENIFYESKLLRSLGESVENNVLDKDDADAVLFEGVLTSAVEPDNVFTVLNRANYQSNFDKSTAGTESKDQKATYVEDHMIPDIYRQLLVEQYILDESYDTLGRTSARHISVLSISKNSNYAKGAVNLMNTYVNDVIFDNARTEDIDLDSFKVVSNAWVGTFMKNADYATNADTKEMYDLMYKAIPEYFVKNKDYDPADPTTRQFDYIQGTAYGDMMEEWEKINDNPKLSENESTYTGSNSYTIQVGKDIKTRELETKDYTFRDWYIKSNGVSDLPDSLKTQLFDINVANALNGSECVEYSYDATNGWTTNEKDNEGNIRNDLINVVGKVNGQYFLRNTSRIKGSPVQNDILFENDGKYYIVLVEDAIRSTNLNKTKHADDTAEQLDTLENYVNEIVQIVANNDTYKNLSKKHWVEQMNLEFHDTVVYEYFKTNFPELFDED